MASPLRIAPPDREFLALVSQATFSNPFGLRGFLRVGHHRYLEK